MSCCMTRRRRTELFVRCVLCFLLGAIANEYWRLRPRYYHTTSVTPPNMIPTTTSTTLYYDWRGLQLPMDPPSACTVLLSQTLCRKVDGRAPEPAIIIQRASGKQHDERLNKIRRSRNSYCSMDCWLLACLLAILLPFLLHMQLASSCRVLLDLLCASIIICVLRHPRQMCILALAFAQVVYYIQCTDAKNCIIQHTVYVEKMEEDN